MCEILRSNFEDLFPIIEAAIFNAEFIGKIPVSRKDVLTGLTTDQAWPVVRSVVVMRATGPPSAKYYNIYEAKTTKRNVIGVMMTSTS